MAQWKHTIKLKDLLDDEDVDREEAKRLGGEMALRLLAPEPKRLFGNDIRLQAVIERFQTDCLSQPDFNDILDDLYDWADNNRVWID